MARSAIATPSARSGRLAHVSWWRMVQAITPWRGEVLLLTGFLLVMFGSFLYRLASVVISDMDEGTYVYAGTLVARGSVPYRDFFLTHPPLSVMLLGGWIRLFGDDLMVVRLAYLTVILAGTVPLYLLVRTLARSRAAGLFGVAIYMAGMLFLADMGRTVRLEPLMNVFLIGAFACYLLRPDSPRARAAMGVLCALAVLVKLVAVIPLGLLVVGDLLWMRRGRRSLVLWTAAAAGAAVVAVPALIFLLNIDGFVDAVVRLQLQRPGLPLQTRVFYLRQDFVRDPLIPVALVAAAWYLLRGCDPRLRVVSLVSLGGTLALVFGFKTFFGYYLVQELPFMAIVVAVAAWAVLRRWAARWASPLLLAGAVTAALVLPLLYGEWYYRTAHDHVSGPARIVAELRGGDGYLYTMYPSFALQSGRQLYPWRYAADSLVPRITGRLDDNDFIRVFSGSQALVLYTDELADYPAARAYVEREFHRVYVDPYYALWVR